MKVVNNVLSVSNPSKTLCSWTIYTNFTGGIFTIFYIQTPWHSAKAPRILNIGTRWR